jgi:uncharacterized membrane protein YidH (DUF202 family)
VEGDEATEGPTGRDSGLARERTDLAWNRSGLAVAVTVAIVLRRLWPLHGKREFIAFALIAVGAVTWVVGMRLGRRIGMSAGADGTLGESACRILTTGTLLLALAGFVVGVL